MNMYIVRMMYSKHLQFATDRTIIYTTRSLSCSTFPTIFPLQCTKVEKKWQCLKLQRSNFHTTQRLHASPLFTLMLCSALQFGSAASGYCLRNWWVRQTPERQEKYKRWYWERRHTLLGVWGSSTVILLMYYLMNFEKDPVVKRPRFIIFDKDDQEALGNLILTTLLEKFKDNIIPISDPMYSRLSRILKKLADANIEIFKNTQWTISVIDAPLTNAMVLPGGNVFVFSGIFDVVENDDQLTFVLAHEISHVLLLHTIELFSYKVLKELVYAIPSFLIWASFSRWKALHAYLVTIFLHKVVFQFPYQRHLELEADDVGIQLAGKACIDVREILVFWEMMRKYSELTGEDKYQIPLLMTHPTHKYRQERLASSMPKLLELRNKAGCPQLPATDPQTKLKRYMKDLEDRLQKQEDLYLTIVYPK